MIDLYTWSTPNGRKVSIALEELGLPYTVHPVNLGTNEQLSPEFLAKNPNNKIPAIVDRRGQSPVTVFESGAILVHLAETSAGGNRLYPSSTSPGERAEVLQWLMWQMAGLGPMMGRANRFGKDGEREQAARWVRDEFLDEVERLWRVMDGQLQRTGQFLAAAGFSVADIACYPWIAGGKPLVEKVRPGFGEFEHINRWLASVGARPAVQKGMTIPPPKA
jgi:GST-like protein